MHSISVFGAAGYAGLELVKLLAVHPEARMGECTDKPQAWPSFICDKSRMR